MASLQNKKSKFLTAQSLVEENNCISCSKTHPGRQQLLTSLFCEGHFPLLLFCSVSSHTSRSTQSNWCCTAEYLGPACSILPPWRYNLQICLGKHVLIEGLGAAPPAALPALQLPEAEDKQQEGALWKIYNFFHLFGDGDILHKQGDPPKSEPAGNAAGL